MRRKGKNLILSVVGDALLEVRREGGREGGRERVVEYFGVQGHVLVSLDMSGGGGREGRKDGGMDGGREGGREGGR